MGCGWMRMWCRPAGVDRAALYAGESALRMSEVMSAKRAVAELAG